MTALGRPCVSAASSVGASAHTAPPARRSTERSVTRVGGEPAAERRQRQRERATAPRARGTARRATGCRARASDRGERIGGSDRVEPRCAQPVGGIRPQLRRVARERLQRASAEHRPRGQSRERGDRHDDGAQNEPGARRR